MPIIHFLNVNEGDCTIIQHYSGHVSVIDVCNAKPQDPIKEVIDSVFAKLQEGVSGNFGQKDYPVNPISYLKSHGIDSVFRFIVTHPDMDHIDGIKLFFATFSPVNMWDTNNTEEKDFSEGCGGYNEEDWDFYKNLRDTRPDTGPRRLVMVSGTKNKYFNQDDSGGGGDGLHILAPTHSLVSSANECGDFNDCSYVLLYRAGEHKIAFGGDSHDETWEHILSEHADLVSNIDVLIAPHHGRDSGRSYDFLDVLKPKVTLFGNARSQHLAYGAWRSRKLPIITNNQAGTIIINAESEDLDIYVAHEKFAKKANPLTFYSESFKAYYYGPVKVKVLAAAR